MALLLVLVGASFGLLSPDLASRLATTAADARLPVHVVLKEQYDSGLLNSLVEGMPKAARRMEVARILQAWSAEQQAGILDYLAGAAARGAAADVTPLWIVNAVYCAATPEVIRAYLGDE